MEILNTGEYTGEIKQKMNFEDVLITNTFYSAKKSSPEWHYHENLHICFVFQGGKAETRNSTKYTEKGGSIFFYHSEETHRWISPQPISKSANIEIGNHFLKKYSFKEYEIKEAIQSRHDAKILFLKLQNELLENDSTSIPSIQSLLLELLSTPKNKTFTNLPIWVLQLREILNDHWDKEISLLEIAQLLQVHPVTISKNFRKYFSCTLGEYRRSLKIERSIDLIKNSKESLSEIAYKCGFADQSHFIRNFKTKTGFLPKAFRKL